VSVQSSDIAGAWRSSPVSSVRPQDLVLVSDFDGTLAEIVPEPDSARALPAAVTALRELRGLVGTVALISGRSTADLQRLLELCSLTDTLIVDGDGVYDLGAGGFSNLELTDVKGAETLTYGAPVVGEVRIGDRNYGRAKPWHRFLQDSGGKADLIVRIKWNGFHLTGQDGSAFDLIDHLATLPNDHLPHEIDVQALVRRGVTTPIRLIILRKPPEAVEATRKTLHAQANRKQRVLDPRTLIAAEFLILGTSLPGEDYPAVEVLAAYRLRWQIELAFKRLKSLLHIDKLPARTDLGARSWLYPHLILALLCDDLSQVFLESFPSGPFRCRISAFTVDSAESRSMGTG